MKYYILLSLFFGLSCKDTNNTTKKSETKPASFIDSLQPVDPAVPIPKDFKLENIKISASVKVHQSKDAPTPEDMEKCIRNELLLSPFFKKDSIHPANIQVTYDIFKNNHAASLVLLANMKSVKSGHRFEGGTRIPTTFKKPKLKDIAGEACKSLAKRLTNNLAVTTANDEELLAILADPKTDPEILKIAVQNVREKNLIQASKSLIKLLQNKDRHVAVGAAAALAKFKDKSARLGVLELAEDLAREKSPSYIPALYILGDLGGPEITEYLSTVASEHDIKKIRETASEVLEKMENKGSQK